MHESDYIKHTPISHRKDYGQFFTPSSVARLMVQWVLNDNPTTVLDPAFGLGIFYDEVLKTKPSQQLQFIGYEIDKKIIGYLNSELNKSNLKINNCDYLEANAGSFDGIICNPPYMRFQNFLKRHSVLPKIEKQIGKKLVGYSNISSVFLLKALNELNDNGNLAFIMPFEFFNTGYGKEVKRSLLKNHLLKQIIIFSNEKEIFPDATTTVCVLLCKKNGKEEDIKITQIKAEDEISQLSNISNFYHTTIEPSNLPSNKKWTPILLSIFSEQTIPEDFVKLSLYGSFTRGIATGANDFFALTKTKIEKWKLDNGNICKCITKSPQIRKAVFTEYDFDILYNSDKPVYCLDVRDHESKRIRQYIDEGEKLKYHERYLTKVRSPWYKIERRKTAPILFGVFNRGRLKVIRNFTTAINFTCFHAFYPNMFGVHLIDKLFVYLLSDIGQEIIKANKRSYGNNLDKFEPGDLNDCFCPSQNQFNMIDNKDAESVIEIAKTDEKSAIQMSNNLIQRIINDAQRIRIDCESEANHNLIRLVGRA